MKGRYLIEIGFIGGLLIQNQNFNNFASPWFWGGLLFSIPLMAVGFWKELKETAATGNHIFNREWWRRYLRGEDELRRAP
jgi:uncharacterized membrane protein